MNNKEKIEKCRKILYKYSLNQSVNREDFKYLFEIIQKHDRKEDKIGLGIKEFLISETKYKNRCFIIKRKDDSVTDFSFMKCINKTKYIKKRDFINACRTTIKNQISYFRKKCVTKFCIFRKIKLNSQNSHVDHIYPFDNIVHDFIRKYKIKINNVKIGGYKDNEVEKYFLDKNLKQLFYKYHKNVAELRLISKDANLSDAKKIKNKSILDY